MTENRAVLLEGSLSVFSDEEGRDEVGFWEQRCNPTTGARMKFVGVAIALVPDMDDQRACVNIVG